MQIITNLTNHLSHLENKPGSVNLYEITYVGNRPLNMDKAESQKDYLEDDFEDDGLIAW